MAYRRADEASDLSSELIYLPLTDDDGAAFGWALLIFGGGTIAGALIAGSNLPNVGGAVIVAAVALAAIVYFFRRRTRGIRLRIARGDLSIFDHGKLRASFALSRLENVIVDTDTVDWGRIVLVREPPDPLVPLTASDVPRHDCIEWAAKIRTFLRANGWTPPDERPV
jgi:hypothetical protein